MFSVKYLLKFSINNTLGCKNACRNRNNIIFTNSKLFVKTILRFLRVVLIVTEIQLFFNDKNKINKKPFFVCRFLINYYFLKIRHSCSYYSLTSFHTNDRLRQNSTLLFLTSVRLSSNSTLLFLTNDRLRQNSSIFFLLTID